MNYIKIIHVITRLDKGGASRVLLDIAKTLNKGQFSIKIISGRTSDEQEDLKKFSKQTGIEIIFIDSLRRDINIFLDIFALFKLLNIFKKEKPDIVQAHTSKAGFLSRIAAKLANVPAVIYMPHGHIFYGYTNPFLTYIYVLLERFAAGFCDYIVTLSNIESEEFLSKGIGRSGKFLTIHNGIDLKNYQTINGNRLEELKKEIGFPLATPVITVISRLEPVKGVEVFIGALEELSKSVFQFKALIVGSGSLRQGLEKKAKSLNLGEKILFLGQRDDINEIIFLSDVVVNPAMNEGLGLVILEAQVLGKPVVATKVGGVPEVITDNQTGILVPVGDPKAMAGAISRVLKDKDLAASLIREAKKRVEIEFSKEKMISKFENLYLNLSKNT